MFGRTVTPKPGVYFDVPFDEYRNWDCASVSILKNLDISEQYCYENAIIGRDTEALRRGGLIDSALLTPEGFSKEFVVLPNEYPSEKTTKKSGTVITMKPWSGNSTYCKDYVEKIKQSGKTIAKASDMEMVQRIKKKLRAHPLAMNWLTGAKQVAIVWIDPTTGLLCKGLIDNLCLHYNMLVDLKSTATVSKRAFRKNLTDFSYHIQVAMYLQGYVLAAQPETIPSFGFVVVGTGDIPSVGTFSLREDSVKCGLLEMVDLLKRYKIMKEKHDDYQKQITKTLEVNPKAELIPVGTFYPACTEFIFNSPNEELSNSEMKSKRLEERRHELLKSNQNLLIPPEISIYDGIVETTSSIDPYDVNLDIQPYKMKPYEAMLADVEFVTEVKYG